MNSEFHALLELLAMLLLNPRTCVLIGLLLIASWSDCRSGRIPNGLVLNGALLGLAYNTLVPEYHVTASTAFLIALAGLACGLLAMLPFYLLRAMGAGDVKLMAMSGAFLGFPDALWAVLATFVAGGVLSLAYLLWKRSTRRAMHNVVVMLQNIVLGLGAGTRPWLGDDKNSAGTLPYGLAIAAGTIGYLVLRQVGFMR